MAVRFETYLTEKQAVFIRRSLAQTIDSMRLLLLGLHRENARWHSPETDNRLTEDEAEIAALQYLVDEIDKLEKSQGWAQPDPEPRVIEFIETESISTSSDLCPINPTP